jgi:outer membrane protein TolC
VIRRSLASLAAVAVLTAAAPAAFAQAPLRTVEFQEAVDEAVARNPTTARAQTAILQAQALLQQSRAALMPTVSANVTSVTLNSSRGFEDTVTVPRSQVTFAAEAAMPLLALEARARANQARDQIEVAELASVEVRQQVAVATAYAYLGVIAAKRQLDVDQRSLEAAQAHLDFANRRLEGGAGSRLNQLRAAQAASTAEARLENTRLALAQAQEALGLMLVAEGPVDAGGEPTFDLPQAGTPANWLLDRPDIQRQLRAVAAAERVVSDSRKSWFPTASVSFAPQAVAPASLFSPSRTWSLAFNVSQPIFTRRFAAERALREVALSESRIAREELEIQARSEERIARQTVESTERALTSAREAAAHAQEVLTITMSAFELGATTNLEVIDAQRSARDAETAVAVAEDAARRATFELAVALGRFK